MLQAEHRGTAPPAGSVRQNCRPDCRSPWARRVVLRMALTCTRLRRTSTTAGAAGNSDQKDAEATLDVSGGDAAPRARCAAATRPSGADITARDSGERREALCSNIGDIPIGRFRRASLSTGERTRPLTLDRKKNTLHHCARESSRAPGRSSEHAARQPPQRVTPCARQQLLHVTDQAGMHRLEMDRTG